MPEDGGVFPERRIAAFETFRPSIMKEPKIRQQIHLITSQQVCAVLLLGSVRRIKNGSGATQGSAGGEDQELAGVQNCCHGGRGHGGDRVRSSPRASTSLEQACERRRPRGAGVLAASLLSVCVMLADSANIPVPQKREKRPRFVSHN